MEEVENANSLFEKMKKKARGHFNVRTVTLLISGPTATADLQPLLSYGIEFLCFRTTTQEIIFVTPIPICPRTIKND